MRISLRFRPSKMKSRSASDTSFPTEARKARQACLCRGWLSTITPSKSKTTPFSIESVTLNGFVPGPCGLRLSIVLHCANIDQVIAYSKGQHLIVEFWPHIESE